MRFTGNAQSKRRSVGRRCDREDTRRVAFGGGIKHGYTDYDNDGNAFVTLVITRVKVIGDHTNGSHVYDIHEMDNHRMRPYVRHGKHAT